jgi:uncharacterized protein YggE
MNNNGITVSRTGTASGSPDKAVLTLGATAVRGEVATALGVVNGRLEGLTSTMAAYGIEGPDIQTSDLSIWPEHNHQGAVSGFRVRNTVKITTTELERLGEIIGAATAALGDLAEMHGLAFQVADPTPLEAQARVQAWERAHDKARQLARLAGTRLGQPVDINETSAENPGPVPNRAFMADSTPVETGSASIEVRLMVRFAQFPDDHRSE